MKLMRDIIRGSTPNHVEGKLITLFVNGRVGRWNTRARRMVALSRLAKFDGYGVVNGTVKMITGRHVPKMWLSCHPFYVVSVC